MDTVLQKRFDQDEERELSGSALAAAETVRSASESSVSGKSARTDDEKVSLFWRVFGGTILSIVALVSITLYNSISSSISELRSELNREREARAELVKKDEFNSRSTAQYERMRSFDGLKAEHEALKERIHTNTVAVETLKKDFVGTADTIKKDAATLEVVKERVALLEGIKKDLAGIELLKERLVTVATDLKTVRDDTTKLQQETERNKAGDVERKSARDSQFKQVEESLKELQKGLQACREKLARLEGAQPMQSTRSSFIPFEIPATGKSNPPPEDDE